MSFRRSMAGMLFAGLAATALSGCHMDLWYNGDVPWPFWAPTPVPQVIGDFIQEKREKQYDQVPIMPPIRDGEPVYCMDPPSEYDILRAMAKPSYPGHIPYMFETHYNDMRFVVEKIVDKVDDCRFYPLVGPAQLHHCHFKVKIYFEKIQHSSYPFAWETTERDIEVVYIDKDHLHICISPEMQEMPESYQDIYGTY